jgi:ribonuclease R
VQGHRDGHGFVCRSTTTNPDIYLSPQEMRSVLHRDRVRVRVVRYDRKGRPEGRVLDIVERRKSPIIGRLLHEGGIWLVAPEDKRYGQDILIPKNATASCRGGAGGGGGTDRAAVDVFAAGGPRDRGAGRDRRPRHGDRDRGAQVRGAAPLLAETLAQAAALPERLRPVTSAPHRPDRRAAGHHRRRGRARLRRRGVLRAAEGSGRGKKAFEGWRLLVAIADVSHYVKPGEAVDDDAYERATSVYFPRRVIPMLPEKLSNGLCSLNPDVERLSMVCDMLCRHTDGEIEAYQFYPAVIRSHARLTYTEVAAMLANTRGPRGPAPRRPGAAPDHLHEVYRACSSSAPARRGGLRDHRDADRLRRQRPHREDRAAHPHRGAQADRGVDAGGQRLRGRLHRHRTSTRRCSACTKAPRPRSG